MQDLAANIAKRRRWDVAFGVLGALLVCLALGVLVLLITDLARDGSSRFGWDFLTSFPSRHAEKAGIKSALVGTCLVMVVTATLAIPLGIATGVYLEEYARKNRLTTIIEINIANLAGVPSIIWGLMALGVLIYQWERFLGDPNDGVAGLGRSVLTAGCTLGLLVLPVDPAVDPRGVVRVRGHEAADGVVAHSAVFDERGADGLHHRVVAGDRRDCAAGDDRCADLHRVPPPRPVQRGCRERREDGVDEPSRCRGRSGGDGRVSVDSGDGVAELGVHGAADPDVQLGFEAGFEVSAECRGDGGCSPGDHAGDEWAGDHAQVSFAEEDPLVVHCSPRTSE
jgi:hypothetical protein